MACYPTSWVWPLTLGLVLAAGSSAIRAQDFSLDDDDEPTPARSYSKDYPSEDLDEPDTQADEPPTPGADAADASDDVSSNDHARADADDVANADDQPGVELIQERYPNRAIKIEREVTQDEQGNYINHGIWKMWDQQGNIIAEGQYRDGERHGLWKRFYKQGDAPLFSQAPFTGFNPPFQSQAMFDNGKLHGKWTIYDSKQRKVSEFEFANGRRNGKMVWYFGNGHKMKEVDYRDGDIDGQVLEWNLDNKLVTKDTEKSGRKQAAKVEYYSPGHKKSEGMYLHAKDTVESPDDWWDAKLAVYVRTGKDEKHGEWTSWYPSGQLQMQGSFDHDAQVGKFTWWHENGQKALEGVYDGGKQNGKWVWWHANGQKSIQGRYVKGNPTGRWIWWHEDGKVAQSANLSHSEGEVVEMPSTPKEAEKGQAPPRVRFKR